MEEVMFTILSIQFCWLGALLTFTLAMLMRFFSKIEMTYDGDFVNLTYKRHWGISIGDVYIMPLITGFALPGINSYIQSCQITSWLAGSIILSCILAVSYGITLYCHYFLWQPCSKESEGLILNKYHPHPHLAPLTGRAHVLFMTLHLCMLLLVLILPMPRSTVVALWVLLSLFLPISTLQPRAMENEYLGKPLLDRNVQRDFCIEIVGVFAVCYLKYIGLF